MRRSFVIAVAALALSVGCKSNCRQLSEKLCDCTNSSTERTSCLQVAANKESAISSAPLTAEDDETCKALLEECDCRLIDTPAGKVRCGFAVGYDAGQ